MDVKQMPRSFGEEGFVPFRLEVCTPVFIGTGETLSPLDYVVKDESVYLVNLAAWLELPQNYAQVEKYLQASNDDMLEQLRKLIWSHLDVSRFGVANIQATQQAATKIQQMVQSARSKGEFMPFMRNPLTHLPYIPASSLKGAISTPLIDILDGSGKLKTASAEDKKDGYRKTLEGMFGRITNHAMQALKIGDIPIGPQKSRITTAVEKRRSSPKPGTPKLPCETIKQGTVLYGDLHIDTREGRHYIGLPAGGGWTLDQVWSFCSEFYSKRFADEYAKFYTLPHLAAVGNALASLRRRIEALDTNSMLLRVGHYSHIENVSVSHNNPKAKKGFGTTRTLADGQLPFGWVILTRCSLKEYQEGSAKIQDEIAEHCKKIDDIFVRVQKQRQIEEAAELANREKQQREQQKRELAQQAMREEAARKKQQEEELAAALKDLSPEEALIVKVERTIATELEANELYRLLSGLGILQARAAVALRDLWMTQENKWKGKPSKKQTVKIEVVKKYLSAAGLA